MSSALPPTSDSAHPAATWAEVRARDRVMRYWRAGQGRTVLLVGAGCDAASTWPELAAALGATFRLIVPELPSAETDAAEWLADFLDGFGCASLAVIATGSLTTPTLDAVELDLDRIERVVVLVADEAPEPAVAARLDAVARAGAVPLLVVRCGATPSATPEAIVRFLSGAG